MNLLSKEDVEDNIMRVVSKSIATELLEITFGKGNNLNQYILMTLFRRKRSFFARILLHRVEK